MHANEPSYWRFLKKSANWALTLWTTVVDSSFDFDYDAYAVNAALSIPRKNCPHGLRRLYQCVSPPPFFYFFLNLSGIASVGTIKAREFSMDTATCLNGRPPSACASRGLGAGVSRTRVFVFPQHMSLCQLQNVKSCSRWAHKTPPRSHRCSIKLLLQRLSVLHSEVTFHQDSYSPAEIHKDEGVTGGSNKRCLVFRWACK